MADTNERAVTVFGGTGFLGRRVVRHLRKSMGFPYGLHQGIRIGGTGCLVSMIRNFSPSRPTFTTSDQSPMPLPRAYGVVNAVSLYVEHGQETFHSVHVEFAQRVAAQARRAGVKRLAHVSGIGSDAASPSLYIRKRGEGELAVRAAFADATTHPPRGDVRTGGRVSHHHPQAPRASFHSIPMFGRGLTKLQPAYVEDVAEAIARAAATDGYACDHIRVRRPSRLLLRGIAKSRCTRSRPQAQIDPNPICRLATRWLGSRKCSRARPSLGIKWN